MSRLRLTTLLLALATLLIFLPATRNSFLNYDDDDYITANPVVQAGLTWAGVKWAFTTSHASNWHPLTWLSHMTDCTLFGLNPAGQHLVNVLFHAANTALLFLLLLRLTGRYWPAVLVAALFAWHPLHVESVAWLAERKDVLSTFFALLSLLAYARLARENRRRDRVYTLVFFACSLMSKPMFVTLPFVLLLLDYWPLGRLPEIRPAPAWRLVLEKWPFFLLTVVSCVITFLAQRNGQAVVSLKGMPLSYRLENAPLAVARYLLKIVWPADLAVIYPMPDRIPSPLVVAAVASLIVISVLVWCWRRQSPWLIVGWLWFLGTLVPVIGLVQVGGAAMADRYTYFPAIGIFIAAAFSVEALTQRWPAIRPAAGLVCGLVLAACVLQTENQLRYWRDSVSLFRHDLTVAPDNNDVALIDMGAALEQEGKFQQAFTEYQAAERLAPGRYQLHNNLGNVLNHLGRPHAAVAEYREAIRLKPDMAALHDRLGNTLVELGQDEAALAEFRTALQLDPAYFWAHLGIADMQLKAGQDEAALAEMRDAISRDPDNYQILAYAAHLLAASDNPEIRDSHTAVVLAVRANELTGGHRPSVLDVLGMACAANGDFTNAIAVTQHALDLARAANLNGLEPLEQRLQLYQKHQPWRESFRATNAPAIH